MSPHATAAPRRAFPNGVYCPVTTPFDDQGELDLANFAKQIVRIAKAGAGLVVMGTNGEANHLSDEERSSLIRTARTALDQNGFSEKPILAGTGTGSAHQTIKLCNQAKEAGADYAIVIAPGYFNFAIGKNRDAIKEFFVDVLDASPIPIMIYNFPGAASGIDLDSDILLELAEHKNCFGVKLTCGAIAKGHRIAAYTQTPAYLERHGGAFQVHPGFSEYLLPALTSRHTGCITGCGDVIPKTIVKLYKTSTAFLETGDLKLLEEARKIQDIVTFAEWAIIKGGIPGTKYALDHFVEKGLGGNSRKPIPAVDAATKESIEKNLKAAVAFENSLP
ncbi:dihydrodipicolinate synthase [Meredithblackwellia eburnea MCA 4105]